jgi:polar amino acid transport system substrate-binding protein
MMRASTTGMHVLPAYARSWSVALALLTSFPSIAVAGCSRNIVVPIAPVGLSVFVAADNSISGVYPELLRNVGLKEGCAFELSVVPRARLELLYESGRADLLIPASRTPARDEFGIFVPLIQSRATLISVASDRLVVGSAQELIDRHDIKVGLVRGFDFGPAYQVLVKELTRQGRVVLDVDAASIARTLQNGAIDMTIMAPSILVGAMQADPKAAGLLEKLRSEPIDELPWGDSGAYISKKVGEPDKAALKDTLERAGKSGAVWKAFQRFYPANALSGSIRPR